MSLDVRKSLTSRLDRCLISGGRRSVPGERQPLNLPVGTRSHPLSGCGADSDVTRTKGDSDGLRRRAAQVGTARP